MCVLCVCVLCVCVCAVCVSMCVCVTDGHMVIGVWGVPAVPRRDGRDNILPDDDIGGGDHTGGGDDDIGGGGDDRGLGSTAHIS